MAGRKKVSAEQKAVEKILEKQSKSYKEWKEGVINERKLAVMNNEDKEWLEETLYKASLELIMEDVISEPKAIKIVNSTNTGTNETKSY